MPTPDEPVNKKSSTQNLELLSRLDERVKNLTSSQKKIEEQLAKSSKAHASLANKISSLESDLEIVSSQITDFENQELDEAIAEIKIKLQSIEMRVGNNDSRWFLLFDSVWKVVLMLIASYILYKLGWQAPTAP